MSRLANPGAGDLADRLTILALKILLGGQAGKDTAHWETERSQLLPKVKSITAAPEHWLELAAVNAALWHAEDDLRALRFRPEPARAQWAGFGVDFKSEVVELAFRIQALNDRRAELISLININAGDDRGDEK
jgi:hypothetical protein